MGIEALPQTTVRAIAASQVLPDSAAVVKELLDNALDAHATSMAVEISTNTLDLIQVRDNGHGISPEDRPLVARRYCTSKMSGENDLKSVAGSSLGFRGEALASVAEMSGSLTISTRVRGEQVAAALKINQQGEVVSQERASLPIGTLVKITDFIKANPVRRQVALKNTEKCLKKIKQSLQAYAFARPHVRLSLRVLKAKNDRGNWMYAPKAGGNAEDAAFKIVGAACASQCTCSVVEHQGFTLQAFLPRPEAELNKVSNIGAFISVDGRPVSGSRAFPKQILKIFKESLKKVNARVEGVKDPFLCLEIACPLESYDANIEPAKDDILFENPDMVVEAARRLFAAVYPIVTTAMSERHAIEAETAEPRTQPIRQATPEDDGFITSLEKPRGPRRESPMPNLAEDVALQNEGPALPPGDAETVDVPRERRLHAFRSNMYGCDEEDLNILDARPPTGRTEADFEELRQARNDVNVSNPWVLAKLNAPVRRPVAAREESVQQPTPGYGSSSARLPPTSPDRRPPMPLNTSDVGLPTPRPSSPSRPDEPFHPSDHVPNMRFARDGWLIGPPSLPSPQMPTGLPSSFAHVAENAQPRLQTSRTAHAHNDAQPTEHNPPSGTPLKDVLGPNRVPGRTSNQALQQVHANKPFVSPVIGSPPKEKVWFDHLEKEPSPRRPIRNRRQWQPGCSAGLVAQGELSHLLEDGRSLTPLRRNRDIRDFVGSVSITGSGSAASMVEKRHYPPRRRASSAGPAATPPMPPGDENDAPVAGIFSGGGFIPASELAAMESRIGPLDKETARPPKRRRTSESRGLRQISGNAAEPHDEDYHPTTGNRAAPRRKGSSKVPRTKSSRLPLERVPAGQGMHDVCLDLPISSRAISEQAGGIDEECSLLGWNQPAVGAYDAFVTLIKPSEMNAIGAKLQELLINRVSDGEMIQDLGELVSSAIEVRRERAASGGAD